MTDIETPTDPGRAARGEPLRLEDGVPVFSSGEAPAYLRTATQLRQQRLKVRKGQLPLAYVVTLFFIPGAGATYGQRALYDPAGAERMRPLPGRVKLRMEARRTCPKCSVLRPYIVRGECTDCRGKAAAAQRRVHARTCGKCGATRPRPYPVVRRQAYLPARMCPPCRLAVAAERREREARLLLQAVTCGGLSECSARVASKAEYRRWRKANPTGWWQPRVCPACTEEMARRRAERLEAERREREAERRARLEEVARLQAWAAAALADPTVVVLDTETTGLDSDSLLVEIAVITTDGEVLLDTLLHPGVPIPVGATRVHGITNEMVEGQPLFSDILVKLTGALMGRRVLIYNASYDVGRLRWALTLHYRMEGHADPEASAAAWLDSMTFADVMMPYSAFVGDWSDYHGNYRWQPLGGGHRALGDCRAVLDVLCEMARGHGDVPVVPAPAGPGRELVA
ncbi:exonuclease domain-containing protein [Kitasatospora sp. NPDC052868]|uniref:exonuclease domain-containing protein n=1 Tax=Kitasatospora sp. NPDC052868 TaxID=3364060 RepID=UPI0037CC1CBD